MSARRLRVLIADDEPVSRRLISAALRTEFELLEVEDGLQALELFEAFKPDAVLLDVEMPNISGVNAARGLKEMAGERFVPIFLVSGLEEQATLIRGLAAGADDFLPKPFNAAVFKPKLNVFLRLQDMQRRLLEQNETLETFQRETRAEQAVAVEVFDRMLRRGALSDPRVRVMLSPLSVFNGDAVLANLTPDGRFRILAADVSGHGLTGALGTMPLTTLFHATTERGDDLISCARQLNRELKATLPSRLFCSATLIELDRAGQRAEVINCGMPELQVLCAGTVRTLASHNIPLGVSADWVPRVDSISIAPGDRVFVMSDGIVEASNDDGELFGAQRVQRALTEGPEAGAFDRLTRRVAEFCGRQSDDVSLIEIVA